MSAHSSRKAYSFLQSDYSLLITHYSFSIVDVILHHSRRARLNKKWYRVLIDM